MSAAPYEVVAERRRQIVALTRQGATAQAIADRLGVTERTVQRGRAVAGITQPAAPEMTGDEKRAAQAMLDDGASRAEVARTLGRAHTTIIRNFPGYRWDKYQAAGAAELGRAMARLERQL